VSIIELIKKVIRVQTGLKIGHDFKSRIIHSSGVTLKIFLIEAKNCASHHIHGS